MRAYFPVAFGLLLAACGQLPNPNDLATISADKRAAIAYKRLDSAEATLDYKVTSREITDEKRNQLIAELAQDLLTSIDPKSVPDNDQWMYASLLRVTNRWTEVEPSLKIAVKVASTPDRKVNDTLKLAQAEAKNGEVAEAIQTASTVLNVDDKDAAPILISVLYELVPAAEKKGHDKDLADLLVKAMACAVRVKVDPTTDAGKAYLAASRHHLGKAQEKLDELRGKTI